MTSTGGVGDVVLMLSDFLIWPRKQTYMASMLQHMFVFSSHLQNTTTYSSAT